MEGVGNRFNLKSDIRNYRQHAYNSDQRAKGPAVSVPQRNEIGNAANFMNAGDSDDLRVDINPGWNDDDRTNINGQIFQSLV